jgi:hypothetical protein
MAVPPNPLVQPTRMKPRAADQERWADKPETAGERQHAASTFMASDREDIRTW